MTILDTYRGAKSIRYPDAHIDELIGLGRPALQTLVTVLTDAAFEDEWAVREAAKRALPALARDADVPTFVRLMREGHYEVEVAFANLRAPASVAAYAGLLRDGCFDTGLHTAARPHLRDPMVVAACCAWLKDPHYVGDLDFAIAKMAELVGGTGLYRRPDDRPSDGAGRFTSDQPVPEIVPEAAPALRSLLKRPLRIDARRHVASALVRVGDKSGIPELIDILGAALPADAPPPDAYQRHAAGLQLNAVSQTSFYWKPAWDERRSQIVREDQFELAAETFREWWLRAQDEIRFDPATQVWSIK